MSWDLKHHHFDHTVQRHYAVLHDPTTGGEHHLVIYTGHESCPACGHVKVKENTETLDFNAILKEELANLEQSHAQSVAYAKRHNIPVKKMSKTILRLAEPKDMPALLHKLAEQNLRDNTRYPIPEIFDEDGRQADNVPLAYVVERGGEIFGGIIFESKGVEMMLIGCSPRVTLTISEEAPGVLFTLRSMGFRWIRSLVTKSVVKQLKPAMKEAGFTRSDGKFASFFREV